eukprot:gnl/Hemi2/27091_TR9099_c0_g1_i1.p1 gnl/Hemi2/27091_TR9099_c0_g1~~gnl/Hemi2/27091_TR9099_c0_g1_i1.p1  ORF type:complete len:494 (-),score=160.48 gnl/Hemi2/27091_TR9099_c0_g1_i1:295-1776(-)
MPRTRAASERTCRSGSARTSATSSSSSATVAKLEQLPQMIAGVNSDDRMTQIEATTLFRKLLSIERNPPIDNVIATGIIPRLVHFLETAAECPHLQFEAAWALTNIASGLPEHTKTVVESNAVPVFTMLLQTSQNDDVREQSVWALGNIAGDSVRYRDLVLHNGALTPILSQMSEASRISMLRNATWTLSNLCRGKPQPVFGLVKPALPTLAHLLFSNDREVLTDACWALSYLSDGDNTRIQQVIEAGVIHRLVELLLHPDPSVQTPALRTIGNIVTGDDNQTQIAINAGTLIALLSLLTNAKKSIRKEACWTISNITAGNRDQIETVIRANLIPILIQTLQMSELFDVRKEAAWAISNATSGGSPEQIKYLVEQGAIPRLCDLLKTPDVKIITVALEALENILRVGEREKQALNLDVNPYVQYIHVAEGVQKIEDLQEHTSHQIYVRAEKIIDKYFGVEEEKTVTVPPVGFTQHGFGFGATGIQGFGGFGQQ